jgi:hypothetical protein
MKSFADNQKPIDIEDLHQMGCLKVTSESDCQNNEKNIVLTRNNNKWFSPTSLKDFV